MNFIVNRLRKLAGFSFTLELKPIRSDVMDVQPDGEAPQKPRPGVQVCAYYVGFEVFKGHKGHVFIKSASNRCITDRKTVSPASLDVQASSCFSGGNMKRSVPLTQGAPYFFYSSLVVDVHFPHHFSVMGSINDVVAFGLGSGRYCLDRHSL